MRRGRCMVGLYSWRRGMAPDFCGEQAEEGVVLGGADEARAAERGFVVGEVGGAEAGEEAEGEVEGADVETGDGAERSGGDAEVGDEPEGVGGDAGGGGGDELIDFGLGEAVEEEVGDDEVAVG